MQIMLTNVLKLLLMRTMPGIYEMAYTMKRRRGRKLGFIKRVIVERHGLVVLNGPFTGMTYVPFAADGALVPRLLGSYEAELHSVIERILEIGYTKIVNIGCGEGYYAVGLALRLPRAYVYAFDADPVARHLCQQLVRNNGVADRVIISGKCDTGQLRRLPLERALVICDCEGCELDLLRPDLVPGLWMCDILVELHDHLNPSISPSILARFAATHASRLVSSCRRDPAAYSVLETLDVQSRHLAVDEFRPGVMQWAFLESQRHSSEAM